MMRRVYLSAALVVLSAAPLTALADDVVTSFEFKDLDGKFVLGKAPRRVTFLNGQARTIGVFHLYRTGMNAWMIPSGETGEILFETPAAQIRLFFRDQFPDNQSVLTVFDQNDEEIMSFDGTDQQFTEVLLNDVGLMGRITFTNNGGAGFSVIDDFTYCALRGGLPLDDPIPEPIAMGSIMVKLDPVAVGLTAPNWGAVPPPLDGFRDERLFVTDQNGILWAIDLATGEKTVFLDVTARLVDLGIFGEGSFDERGLLGLAFHPEYFRNGLLYTYESHPVKGAADFSTIPEGEEANHQSVITEWTVPEPTNPDSVVDPDSARELLRIDEPQFNHNSGALNFGPDGRLYLTLGDGGGADDVDGQLFFGGPIIGHGTGNGQNPGNPLGAILRIDPQGTNSGNGRYGIPQDNPFVGRPGFVSEIFAYGFRNPFRFSFDRKTGDLMIADVGQNDIEEIDIVEPGGNYGWNLKEGTFFFNPNGNAPGFVTDEDPGVPPGLIDPIAEYDHDEGIAIIGGFVYRGTRSPALIGRYVFGDFARTFNNDGRLFYLDAEDNIFEFPLALQLELGMSLLGSGQDLGGEVYMMANGTGTPFGDTGVVLHIVVVTAAELTDVEAAFGEILEGGIPELLESDGQELAARSHLGFVVTEPNILDLRIGAVTGVDAPRGLDFLIESRNDNPGGTATLRLRNFKTGLLDTIDTYQTGTMDRVEIARNIDATNHVRSGDGRIELSIKESVVATFSIPGFTARYDQVQVVVQ